MELTNRTKCPLCRSDERLVFIDFPDIPVVRCSQCSFMYSSKLFPNERLASYYENDFGSQRHLQGQVVNARLNAWVVLHSLKLSGIKTMLDVGTGYGFLLHEMGKRIQVDAVGVELSRQEATYAQNKLGLKVLNSSLAASGLHRGQYDLVTSFEVIEHIPDPLEFIAEMAQYVKIGGHLLLMTDNFESRMAGSLGAGFPKWIPHAHVSHFSPSTLKSAIEATDGLSLVHSMSYTPWEVFLRDAYYRLRGIKKTPSEAFNLTATLEGEMAGTYRLFRLRRLINRIWMKLALTDEMNGDLMYFLARKTA